MTKHISAIHHMRRALQLYHHDRSAVVHLGMPPIPRRGFREGWGAEYGAVEAFILKTLNAFEDGIHDAINHRASLKRALDACAEGGKAIVIESGMDCDCVQYDGRKYEIDATLLAYRKLDGEIAQWADGRYSLRIESPSAAQRVQYESRDLALEAYENGHPHHIYAED